MDYHVLEARYVTGHTVWLRFRDGTAGEVDLPRALQGPVFAPLHDLEYFRQYALHPAFHTLVWPNGADIAPEYLHQQARVAAYLAVAKVSRSKECSRFGSGCI